MTDVNKQSAEDFNQIAQTDDQAAYEPSEAATEPLVSHWTGSIHHVLPPSDEDFSISIFNQLCTAFNKSPFLHHCGMVMRVEDGEIKGFVDMSPHLIGNVAFQILHGGVAATLLDSIGGIVAMGEIYCHAKGELKDRIRQVSRLATTDMRVDYLALGRGTQFVATAHALRMGRKGCTMRMNLHNNEHRLIATATASYAY